MNDGNIQRYDIRDELIRFDTKLDNVVSETNTTRNILTGLEKSFEAHLKHYTAALERAFINIKDTNARIDSKEKFIDDQEKRLSMFEADRERAKLLEKIGLTLIGSVIGIVIGLIFKTF